MLNNAPKYFFIAILTISSTLILVSIQEGHNWGDDFALYINQSIHIVEGFSLGEIYKSNKYAMQNSITEIGPYLYPNGFPFLLSPIYYFFGIHFILMKAYCSLFFLLSIPIIYLLFKSYFKSFLYPMILICLVAFNHLFIIHSDTILSDFPYMFLCFLTLYLMTLKNTLINQLLLGLSLFFAYFTRDVGVFLIPTIFVYQIFNLNRYKNNHFLKVIPYLIFVAFFFLLRTFFPGGNQNHIEILLSKISVSLIKDNLNYYILLFSRIFFFKEFKILGYLIVIISTIGAFSNIKKYFPFIVFTVLNLTILIIWPFTQGMRFLFTVYPFILFFIIQGVLIFSKKLNTKYIKIPIAVYLILFLFYSLKNILVASKIDSNEAYTAEMIEIYDYISHNIPPEKVIGFGRPRALSLFTNVKSIYTDVRHFEKTVAAYLLVKKDSKKEYENNNIQKEFNNYILLKK